MNFLKALLKYIIEGLAVALCVYLLPNKKLQMKEVLLIGLTAAAVFAILDEFSPVISQGTRSGAGLGIGLQQVGYGLEGFNSEGQEVALGSYDIEGFYASSSKSDNMQLNDICTASGKCTYTKNANPKAKSIFVCSNHTGTCTPVDPCVYDEKKKSCSMDHKYSNLADLSGKECVVGKIQGKDGCMLKTSEMSKIESELFTNYLV